MVRSTPDDYNLVVRIYTLADGRQIKFYSTALDERYSAADSVQRWLMFAKNRGIKEADITHNHTTEYFKYTEED